MRIMVLDYAAESGGALSILNDFYNYVLKNAGHHEWIFIVSKAELEPCGHIKILSFPEIKNSWLARMKWERANLRKIIYKEKADIVFSLQNLAVPDLNLPQIVYVHQSIPFQKLKRFSLLKKEERLLAVYQYVIGRMIWSSIKIADAVIVQAQWMKEAIINKPNICSTKVFVVPPTIDLTKFKNKNLVQDKITAEQNTFFYPAGALLYKNFDCLIKAAHRLSKKGIEDFRIVVTIKGDENSYAARIKKTAEGLGERVVFAGIMSREEVFRMYQSSALIFPSYIETFGLPLLEAKLSGSVIIASDCPFSREILEGYQNAYYFDPFDADLLADLMSRVISGRIVASKNVESEAIEKACGWANVLSIIEGCGKVVGDTR